MANERSRRSLELTLVQPRACLLELASLSFDSLLRSLQFFERATVTLLGNQQISFGRKLCVDQRALGVG